MPKKQRKKSDIILGVVSMASDEKIKSSKSIKELLGQSKEKIISRKKETTSKESKKSTIGEKLISEILESKKLTIERIEISKQAMEALKDLSKQKNVPIEQIVANLIEQNFNPKYQK